MKTERNLFSLIFNAPVEGKPRQYHPEREDSRDTDYKLFLEKSRTGNPAFDSYISMLAKEMKLYDKIDPYKRSPLKPITDKADAFLKRHAGISYEEFLSGAKPEEFVECDYGKLPDKRNLKRRLFEHRAMLYLSALEDSENSGLNIEEILQEIKNRTIPFLKAEQNEPTFGEVLRVLGRYN